MKHTIIFIVILVSITSCKRNVYHEKVIVCRDTIRIHDTIQINNIGQTVKLLEAVKMMNHITAFSENLMQAVNDCQMGYQVSESQRNRLNIQKSQINKMVAEWNK